MIHPAVAHLIAAVLAVVATAATSTFAAPDRVQIAIESRGSTATRAHGPERCPGDGNSVDTLRGIVERRPADSNNAATVYEGVLERVTEQVLCGMFVKKGRPALTQPCLARLSGAGDVHVRIKVQRGVQINHHAWIVVRAIDVIARVTGNCGPGEMREMQRAYSEPLAFEIPLTTGPLTPGRFVAPDGEHGRWEMVVSAVSDARSQ
jgi:hypothetical protein